MSVEAISHIMRTTITDGIAKLVAMVLADYADPMTGKCWPKIPTLAVQCSQSERTVQRKLKVLEELDILHVEPNRTGDRKGNVYVLHLPGVARPPRGDRSASGVGSGPATGDCVSPVESDANRPTGDSAVTRRVTLQSPPIENPPGNPSEESPQPPVAGGARTFDPRIRDQGGLTPPRPERRTERRPRAERRCREGTRSPVQADPETAARFERLFVAFPASGRLSAQRSEAISRFVELTPADQETAIRTAVAYAAECTRTRSQAKALHRWLRDERWRNGERGIGPAVGAAPTATALLTRVFVRDGSPEWEAWAAHYRRLGRPMPSPIRFDSERADGWRFESRLPPGAEAA